MLCPFCKEEIQDGALKCKHCGSVLAGDISQKPSVSKRLTQPAQQSSGIRTAILVLSIIGVALSFSVGGCSGACLSISPAHVDEGAKYMGLGMLEGIIGMIGGYIAWRNFGNDRKKQKLGAILLAVAVCFSITNTFQFILSGVTFGVAAGMAFFAGKE